MAVREIIERLRTRSELTTSLRYVCRRCGFASEAHVTSEGRAPKPGENYSALDAREDAEGAAWRHAVTAVSLAPCPACGRRDWRKVSRHATLRVLPRSPLAVVVAIFAWLAMAATVEDYGAPAAAAAGLAAVLAVTLAIVDTRAALVRSARVAFELPPPGAGGYRTSARDRST